MTPHPGRRTDESPAGRGQTLHDYVAGISVFVLTLAVVLGLLPSVIGPFQAESGTADATEAMRIADRIITAENHSFAGAPNRLNASAIDDLMNTSEATLQTRYGLASHQHINLSLRTMNGTTVLRNASGALLRTGGTAVSEEPRSAARIVTLDDESYSCTPACRLVVKVW